MTPLEWRVGLNANRNRIAARRAFQSIEAISGAIGGLERDRKIELAVLAGEDRKKVEMEIAKQEAEEITRRIVRKGV